MHTTTTKERNDIRWKYVATRTHDIATGSSSLCTLVVQGHAPIKRSGIILDQNLPSCQGLQGNLVLFILQFRKEWGLFNGAVWGKTKPPKWPTTVIEREKELPVAEPCVLVASVCFSCGFQRISAQSAGLRFYLGLLNKSSQKDVCDCMERLSAVLKFRKTSTVYCIKISAYPRPQGYRVFLKALGLCFKETNQKSKVFFVPSGSYFLL